MTTVSMPALGESVEEGTVLTWLKSVGDTILAEEPLLEVATDKVDTEVPSPVAGTVRQLLVEPGALVAVGAGIAVIEEGIENPAPPRQGSSGAVPGFLSPLVRKLAREHDIALGSLIGTGRDGRIRKQDVLAAVESSRPVTAPSPTPPHTPTTIRQPGHLPSRPSEPGERREPMTRVRRSIASAMMSSLQTSAQLTSVVEVDVTDVARTRLQHKESFRSRTGVSLSYLPFFAAAAVAALTEYPLINARVEEDDIVYSAAVNLGIAVDSDRGLFVPVIRRASDLSVQGLARAIADAADRTRANSLTSDDLVGGTFTITNTGSRGALFDTPIISAPQSAILGTGAVVERAAVITMPDGTRSIAIRSMAYLALSYDHRIIDGAVAAGYLTTVKARLESDTWDNQVR